ERPHTSGIMTTPGWGPPSGRTRKPKRCSSLRMVATGRHQEMPVRRRDQAVGGPLPRLDPDVRDAAPVLGDDGARQYVVGLGGAQIVYGEVDRLGQRLALALVHELEDGREFEKGPDHPAVDGGKMRVADQPAIEDQSDDEPLLPDGVQRDPEEARVGDALEERLIVGRGAALAKPLEEAHQAPDM